MTPIERFEKIVALMEVMAGKYYKYDLRKGYSGWDQIPPANGTPMNCQAAARLLKRLAEETANFPKNQLEITFAKPKGGFIVLAGNGLKALGTTFAPITGEQGLACWEFDNHFRMFDARGFEKVYDPIFGTTGKFNPVGIVATK